MHPIADKGLGILELLSVCCELARCAELTARLLGIADCKAVIVGCLVGSREVEPPVLVSRTVFVISFICLYAPVIRIKQSALLLHWRAAMQPMQPSHAKAGQPHAYIARCTCCSQCSIHARCLLCCLAMAGSTGANAWIVDPTTTRKQHQITRQHAQADQVTGRPAVW